MDSLIQGLVEFVGRRIVRAKRLSKHLDVPEETYSGLGDEERANAKESIERDSIYIQGVADGMRLAALVFAGEDVRV